MKIVQLSLVAVALCALSACGTMGEKAPSASDKALKGEDAWMARGQYHKTNQGYYIANLAPTPDKVPGCDSSVLVKDLTVEDGQDGRIYVEEVDVGCTK